MPEALPRCSALKKAFQAAVHLNSHTLTQEHYEFLCKKCLSLEVFRICKPLESLAPLVLNPSLDWRKPAQIEILKKLKCVLMAVYFGADHVVWMKQAGLIQSAERFQKLSMYGWFGGSLCTIVTELYKLQDMMKRKQFCKWS